MGRIWSGVHGRGEAYRASGIGGPGGLPGMGGQGLRLADAVPHSRSIPQQQQKQ